MDRGPRRGRESKFSRRMMAMIMHNLLLLLLLVLVLHKSHMYISNNLCSWSLYKAGNFFLNNT
jgi:hypothetical protein